MTKTKGYLDDDYVDVPDGFSLEKRHFPRRSLTAVLLGLAVIVGLTIWQPASLVAFEGHRPMTMLEHSGGVLLDASLLKNHISLPIHGNYSRYWIGPVAGSKYTTNCVTPGVLQVSYFGSDQILPNQILNDGVTPRLTVSAYENIGTYNTHTHPAMGNSIINLTNSHGDALSIDSASLTRVVVGPLPTQELITLSYSSPQSIATMVRDSENLVKL